jgi:hypothetical protein
MNPTLPREFLPDAVAQSIQDPRSRTLYELCFLHRDHLRDAVVADKLRLIGRLYTAPGAGLGFSPEFSAHRLTQSAVDQWFGSLATAEALDVGLLLELHKRVMDVFNDLPLPLARSLASKYLHFHFPELFCIYDEQVETAAANLMQGSCGFLAISDFDPVYGRFHACCRKLAVRLAPEVGHRLTPLEMDRLLRVWLAYQEAVQSQLGSCDVHLAA